MTIKDEPRRGMQLNSPVIPILVVILFGVQMLFPSKAWMILLSGLGGAWLLSYAWARSLRGGLVLERDMKFGWMQVGDKLQERVTIENNGWAPGLWIKVDDQSDMQEYQISTVTDIRSWKYRFWYSRGICKRRGLYTLGPTTLETGDPLGIYKVEVEYPLSVNMMVAPQVISLPEIEIAAGGRLGEGKSSMRGFEHTVTAGGVREYVAGDSLRWIHWPTTARKESPFVHLFDNEPASDWWVVLDMDPAVHIGEGDQSTEEYGVILAASIVNRGLQDGKAVGLISQGQELVWHSPGTGDVQLWKVLRSLALLKPGGPPLEDLLERVRGSLGQRVSMVIITPNLSPIWLRALEHLKRVGIVPTVILIDPVSFGGFGNIQGVRDRLIRLGIAHYTITSELLEPQEDEEDPWGWLFVPASRQSGAKRKEDKRLTDFLKTLRNGGLAFLGFFGMANAVGETVQGVEGGFLWYLISIAMVVGWVLTKTSFPGWIVGFLSTLVGIIVTTLRVGRFENQIVNFISRVFTYVSQWVPSFFSGANPPEGDILHRSLNELMTEVTILGARFWEWSTSGLRGEPFFDPVAAVMIWGVLIWSSVTWAIWSVFRRGKPIIGSVPTFAIVGISLTYFQQTSYDLVLVLGATIALGVLVHHDVRERIWEKGQLFFDKTIRPRVLFTGIGLGVGLMVLAVVSPSISIESMSDFIRELGEGGRQDPSIARSIGLRPGINTRELNILELQNLGALPNVHLIGSAPELSDEVVMNFKITGFVQGETVESPGEVGIPQYIRNLTFDRYIGTGWISRDTEIIQYSAGEFVYPFWLDNHLLIRQEVELTKQVAGLIYAQGSPFAANGEFGIAWRIKNDKEAAFDFFGGTIESLEYVVDSFIPVFSEDQLREAGQAYPEWVRSRYMSLPSSVPDRVLTLARDITATELTPYDRAVALEQYLRRFPYTLDVSQPPVGVDLADFFLFSLQKGYCDYYASSMVVLARAAGLPARLATGYIAENFDSSTEAFVVTADQAHAWVEIYFPGYGWIPFEPTGGRSAIDRPTEPVTITVEKFDLPPPPLAQSQDSLVSRIPTALILFGLFVIGFILVWLTFHELRLYTHSRGVLLSNIYRRLYRYGRWVGVPPTPSHTPIIFSNQLVARFLHLGRTSHVSEWILQGVEDVEIITDAYLKDLFCEEVQLPVDPGQLRKSYQRLRVRLWVLWLLGKAYTIPSTWSILWRTFPVADSTKQVSEA